MRSWRTLLAWSVAGCCLAAGFAWPVSEKFYLLDIAASFQSVVVGAIILGAAVCAVLRRLRAFGVCLLALAVGAWPLVQGRAVALPGVDLGRPPAPGTVRVVSFNISPLNTRWRDDFERALSWHADIVVIIEPTWGLVQTMVKEGTALGGPYPYSVQRAWVENLTSPTIIFSRWPLERLSFEGDAVLERDMLVARVDRPGGAFLVSGLHPHSPRTAQRWAAGNAVTMGWVRAMDRTRAQGPAVVLAADLNAGPAAWRSRLLRAAGMSSSKPLLGGVGSFPAEGPALGVVQIDDVWGSRGVEAVAWSSVEPLGSDHRAVVVDIQVGPR